MSQSTSRLRNTLGAILKRHVSHKRKVDMLEACIREFVSSKDGMNAGVLIGYELGIQYGLAKVRGIK